MSSSLEAQNAALHRVIDALTRQLETLTKQLDEQRADNRQLRRLIEGLQRQVADFLALQGKGSGASEILSKADETPVQSTSVNTTPPTEHPPPKRRKRKKGPKRKPKRVPLPPHLERDVHTVEQPSCPSCGSDDLAQLDPEVSEKLDYIRAHIRVRRIERESVRCRGCRSLSTAPMPPTAVPGGNMTSGFLAYIAYGKCALHLPLARIAKDLRNQGIRLSSSTLCDAIKHVAVLAEPIADRIRSRLFSGGLVHADGTGLKVLEPGRKGSHRGQIAVFCNEEVTAFHFSETKEGKHLAQYLRVGGADAYQGFLVADAASNMNLLYADGKIIECGCWYHLRDKFVEAHPGAPPKADEALAWIGTVFDVESDADEAGDSAEERLSRRRAQTLPLINRFERWMEEARKHFIPGEELYKATQYYTNHRGALRRFLSEGRIPISNNVAERELGVIGRGRKNYLFAGSDEGARRLAIVYTVVRTCERLGIDPFRYLADVLKRLSVMPANREQGLLDRLTPWAWAAAQP